MKVKEIIAASEPQWIKNGKYEETDPLITVVLPTFRRARSGHFERAVESVISQTFTNWELIIVDDASTDGTFDLVKFYMSLDSRINCIRHTNNMGLPAISEYEAYIRSRGKYIAYIFDDNVWAPDHLMLSMKAMVKNNVKFTYGIARSYDKDNSFTDLAFELNLLPFTNVIGNGAVVIHKDIIEKVGLYDPHVVLTRICDWDWWRRIIKECYLNKIDAIVTSEYGPGLNDSLGNSLSINAWAAFEQVSSERNEKLHPENFEEYDIIDCSDRTDLFCEMTKKFYQKYSTKKWWKELGVFQKASTTKKQIIVATSNFDASLSLSFDSLITDSVIKYVPIQSISSSDIAFADAIIFVRLANYAVDFAKNNKFNIPVYYYTDDNFIELANETEGDKDPLIRLVASCMNKNSLKYIDGIITSTNALKDFFESNDLHHNVITLPVCATVYDVPATKKQKTVNIGFIGGRFREDSFLDYIYPALVSLSSDVKIKLVCPDTLAERIKNETAFDDDFEIKSFSRDISYYQTMHLYESENIHILVHCGEENVNNKYKTLNSLVNAVRLGAVLIASNIPPFNTEPCVVTCDNKVSMWISALEKYILNESERNSRFIRQQRFVQENYAVEKVSAIFEKILSDITPINIADTISRYDLMVTSPAISEKVSDVVHDVVKNNYSFIDNILVFSELGSKPVIYKLRKTDKSFSRIGFVFSSDYSVFNGTITAEVLNSHNKCIASSTLDMKDINIREVNCFSFDTIIPNNNVKIRLTANYCGSETIGIYELAAKRSFLFKAFKKVFKKRLLIPDLAYYELF
ncbi:MAG: glycosyltransferase [Bacteroides sp.]|nr:glycosyltransferase [Bacteroides sp.]